MTSRAEELESFGAAANREPKPFRHVPSASKILRGISAASAWSDFKQAPSCPESTSMIHTPTKILMERPDPGSVIKQGTNATQAIGPPTWLGHTPAWMVPWHGAAPWKSLGCNHLVCGGKGVMDVNHPPWSQGQGLLFGGGISTARNGKVGDLRGLRGKGQ